jgi:ubiquinone/menaquinone biosynthesis C-methylase UbiE
MQCAHTIEEALGVDNSAIVRDQFNKQAARFDRWSVTRDDQHADFLLEMAGIGPEDAFLDVACGTGALAIRAARRARSVVGVDLSERMLELAAARAAKLGLENLSFQHSDTCALPFEAATFSGAGSKSAFHHMPRFRQVFGEMARCTRPGGVLCIQDIISYGDSHVDAFMEGLELAIDESHARTLSKADFSGLFEESAVKVKRAFESVSRLDMDGYIGHAVQTPENAEKILIMLERGRRDARIAHWLDGDGERLIWKRKVLTISGRKEP